MGKIGVEMGAYGFCETDWKALESLTCPHAAI